VNVDAVPTLAQSQQAGLSRPLSVLRELVQSPSGLIGIVVVAGLVVMLVFAPLLAPYDYAQQDIPNRLQGPSAAHLLGTDHLGRDLLSRVVFGSRVAMGVALPAVLASLSAGLVLGLVAGYLGGKVDALLLVLMDAVQAFPPIFLALALLAVLGPSLESVVFVISVAFTPGYWRIVRAQVLSARENPYIEAERSLGASNTRVVFIHILPNIVAPLITLLAMDLPYAVTFEAGLSFLGLGVQPPTPSWGLLLSQGFEWIRDAPWMVLWTGLILMLTTLGFTLFGEALRDILDPRLAGTRRIV
jgi:peptide/nickel transport system permease protein